MDPNHPTDQPNPYEQIQAREKEIQDTINSLQLAEAMGPQSERGRECRDMIDILREHGFALEEIKHLVGLFWGKPFLKNPTIDN